MPLRRSLEVLVLTALLGSASVLAADAPKATTAPVPLLWKVSDKDNAVYLLGSFHLLRPTDYPVSGDVEAAFADAERVMFELSPDEMRSQAMPQLMMQAAIALKMKLHPPHLFLRPSVNRFGVMDFLKAHEILEESAPIKGELKRGLEGLLAVART